MHVVKQTSLCGCGQSPKREARHRSTETKDVGIKIKQHVLTSSEDVVPHVLA